jgi:hypothetical protein
MENACTTALVASVTQICVRLMEIVPGILHMYFMDHNINIPLISLHESIVLYRSGFECAVMRSMLVFFFLSAQPFVWSKEMPAYCNHFTVIISKCLKFFINDFQTLFIRFCFLLFFLFNCLPSVLHMQFFPYL